MPKADDELVVIEKTQQFLVWSLHHIEKFPRSHRYGMGLRIEVRLSDLLDNLIEAKYCRDRLPILSRCNLELERLRFQFRTAKDLRCLSVESYGSASRSLNEIGQIVGSWMKSIIGGAHAATRQPMAKTGELRQSADGGTQSRPG